MIRTGRDVRNLSSRSGDSAWSPDPLLVRSGQAADCREIAELAHAAGGDVIQFTLGSLSPGSAALDVYRDMVADPDGIFSFKRCIVADFRGEIVGVANSFPASLMRNEFPALDPSDRELLLKPRFDLNDWNSFLLNNICIVANRRRTGVGTVLMNAVISEAMRQGYRSLTLHVWADNLGAIAFYRSFGFRRCGVAPFPWHVDLPHKGGSLLMKRPLRSA